MSNKDADTEYENLKNSKFKQQKLPAWRPVPTITSTFLTFLLFGIAFIIIGSVVLSYSNQIVEVSIRYDTDCKLGSNCNITIPVNQQMDAPIMVYYQLNNFYQNHRRYVKSKSNSQLLGNIISKSDLETSNDCDPIFTMGSLGKNTSYDGTYLDKDSVANPCGLIAKSLFTDRYNLYNGNRKILINEKDIAWDADKKLKYARAKNPSDPNDSEFWKKVQWTDVEDEHFMVWMRPAGLSNFRKLWGRINETLTNGTSYTMSISNFYNVTAFNGQKFIVLSTVNSFGGRNNFLGISYIVVGSICVLMAIAFLIGYKCNENRNKKE